MSISSVRSGNSTNGGFSVVGKESAEEKSHIPSDEPQSEEDEEDSAARHKHRLLARKSSTTRRKASQTDLPPLPQQPTEDLAELAANAQHHGYVGGGDDEEEKDVLGGLSVEPSRAQSRTSHVDPLDDGNSPRRNGDPDDHSHELQHDDDHSEEDEDDRHVRVRGVTSFASLLPSQSNVTLGGTLSRATSFGSTSIMGSSQSQLLTGAALGPSRPVRLTEEQQEDYVRKSFPSLVIGQDPFGNATAHQRKEPRTSPHIVSLTGRERKKRTAAQQMAAAQAAAAAQAGDPLGSGVGLTGAAGEHTLPLYLSKDASLLSDPGSAGMGLTLPALPRSALSASGGGAGSLADGLPGTGSVVEDLGLGKGLALGNATSYAKRRKEAGLAKARLAMQVAKQMEMERAAKPLGHFALGTLSSSGGPGVNTASSGSLTDRTHMQPRGNQRGGKKSPKKGNATNGSQTSRLPTQRSQDSFTQHERHGSSQQPNTNGDEDEEEEDKTFLTAYAPFSLPAHLAASTIPSTYSGIQPTPGGVQLNPRGTWIGPVGDGKESRYARLVQTTQSANRWTEVLFTMSQALFRAKCSDMGIAPSSERRERKWIGELLRQVRLGHLALAQNGLAEHSVGVICEFLKSRLVPESVLQPVTPVHFITLSLQGNHLGDEGALVLAGALGGNGGNEATTAAAHSLREVNLGSNRLSAIGINKICLALSKSPSLTSLDLSSGESIKTSNYIGPGTKGANGLKILLERSKTLISLSCVNLGLGLVSGAMNELCIGIEKNHSLITLNLGQNGLGQYEAELLCDSLGRNERSTIQNLLLSKNHFGSLGCIRFGQYLREYHTIGCLNLSSNDVGLYGFLLLTDSLAANPCLDRLVLNSNFFGSRPSLAIHKERRLGGSSSKGGNHITEEQLIYLASEIRSHHLREYYVPPRFGLNHAIRSLSLKNSGLSDEFISKLMEILFKQNTLTQLNLSYNNIHQLGCESIAAFLGRNPPLKSLDLSFNQINDSGGESLTRALSSNNSLTSLFIQHNDLGEIAAESLLGILNQNSSLTYINVDGNKIPYRIYRLVSETGTKNANRWENGTLERLQSEVAQMKEIEKKLIRTNKQVEQAKALDLALVEKLAHLDSSHDQFYENERQISLQLKQSADEAIEEHRQVIGEEFQLDMDLKKKRTELDAAIELKRKERDTTKDARILAEKQILRTKETLATFHKESNLDFDEGDRLAIVIQSHEKRNKATSHLIDEDIQRLKEWIKALQAKLDRGESNPYAAPGTDGAQAGVPVHTVGGKGGKKHSISSNSGSTATGGRGRKASVSTAHLLPRTLEGAPIIPAKLTSLLATMSEGTEGEESKPTSSAPSPQPHKPTAPATARKSNLTATSSRTARTVSGAGTLLRPTPLPVDAAKDGMIWSKPVGSVTERNTAGASTARKSKGGGAGKKTKGEPAAGPSAAKKSSAPPSLSTASPTTTSDPSSARPSIYTYTPQATGDSLHTPATVHMSVE